jgi:dUTPase
MASLITPSENIIKIYSEPEYVLHILFDNDINKDILKNYKEISENNSGNAGYDIYCSEKTVIKPSSDTEKLYTTIKSHMKCEMVKITKQITIIDNKIVDITPVQTYASYLLMSRSSMSNYGLFMPHSVGLIDASYRGEILGRVYSINNKHLLINHDKECDTDTDTNSDEMIEKINNKLFQIVAPNLSEFKVKFVDSLSDSDRGAGGFGSTNK